MPGIFISHRSHDVPRSVRHIHDKLVEHFGDENVFSNLEDLAPGEDYEQKIEEALRRSDVLVAVIGPRWIEAFAEHESDDRDWVVLEISRALDREIPVIPVTVENASKPSTKNLPSELAQLGTTQVHQVLESHFDHDIERLIAVLDGTIAPHDHDHPRSPATTVTFLFTDIEGSSGIWERHLDAMQQALAQHDDILRGVVARHDGRVFSHSGDGMAAAFSSARAALDAAIDGQRELIGADWGEIGTLDVRMALNTGAEQERDGNFYGPTLNRAARLLELAHGRQIMLSLATREMVQDRLPQGASLVDLGIHELRSLSHDEQIFLVAHDSIALSLESPEAVAEKTSRTTFPIWLTRFVGRSREVKTLREMLDVNRIVTITGAGGNGKTRLAAEVALQAESSFADGAFFVELDPLVSDQLVAKRTADVLGIKERPSHEILDTVVEQLAHRSILLTMDNCEHVIEGAARTISAIVTGCPGVVVLATSREQLGIPGEQEFRIEGLPVAATVSDASLDELAAVESIELFVVRAQSANPAFQLTADNVGDVAALCDYLDGMPLAIELAASRIGALAPRQLLGELSHRLDAVRSRSRTVQARHQTLSSTIEWSHELLPVEQQRVFLRLSVFEGSFTMEAATSIAGDDETDVFDDVLELVAKSLLVAGEGPDGRARYRMLKTLRQFGRAKLSTREELAEYSRRYAGYYLDYAEQWAPLLQGSDQQHARDQLQLEHDNLSAALDWAVAERDRDIAGRLAMALRWYWYWSGYIEVGHSSMERVLTALSGTEDALFASVSMGAGILADVHGSLDAASAHLERAQQLAERLGEREIEARTLAAMGVVAKDHGNLAEAAERFERSIALDTSTGEDVDFEISLRFLGEVAYLRGDLDASNERLQRALELAQRLERSGEIAWVTTHLGELLRRQGRLEAARKQLGRAIELHSEISYSRGAAWSQVFLGTVEMQLGNAERAQSLLEQALSTFREIADRRGVPYALLPLSELARQASDHEAAGELAAAAERAAESLGDDRALAWARLSQATNAWAVDRTGVGEALAAAQAFDETGDRHGMYRALDLAGLMAAERGHHAAAVRLLGAAAALDGTTGGDRVPANIAGAAQDAGVDIEAEWAAGRAMGARAAMASAIGTLTELS